MATTTERTVALRTSAVRAVRGWVYNRLIAGMTAQWYREVLSRLPDGARMLDVGIGTGAALARCADLVRAKRLQVVGLDIDADYLDRCRTEMARAGLSEQVSPLLASVYDHRDGPYDAVYFSASLMLLPDPVAAIAHVARQLTPSGRVFSTQTFHHRRSRLLERVKPLAQHVTTIDFGRVTYEDEFRRTFADAGVRLVDLVTMRTTRHSSYRLAIAEPADVP
ncbi:class I SAM-dependent methyltransferase [Pseudonocardia nigra]|uniref:class I SAM-dependent methyltransferase n=1 Tax=Pseudonocardia nigra TaxID=1921578 RepID=UPI001C5EE7EA|nr:class I SAM-dependent methyltransferase [Pseudonocardia nigra]